MLCTLAGAAESKPLAVATGPPKARSRLNFGDVGTSLSPGGAARGDSGGSSAVEKRYSQFEAMHTQLAAEWGQITKGDPQAKLKRAHPLPPMPPKQWFGRTDVEQRRTDLEVMTRRDRCCESCYTSCSSDRCQVVVVK